MQLLSIIDVYKSLKDSQVLHGDIQQKQREITLQVCT